MVDLQTNLAAATLHLDFLSSVPTTLANTAVPALDSLESTPVGPIIHSHPLYKVAKAAPLVASTVASTSKASAAKKAKGSKLAKELDPDRWIPKRERPGFAEEIVRKREQERGRKKQLQSGLTQGAAEPVPAQAKAGAGAGGGGGGGGGKKKKGGKK